MAYDMWTNEDDALVTKEFMENGKTYREIASMLPNRTPCAVRGRMKTLGLKRYTRLDKPMLGIKMEEDIDIEDFFQINTPLNAYVYGLMATDGCVKKNRISFNSTDEFLVDTVYCAFSYCGKKYWRKPSTRKDGRITNGIWQWEYSRARIEKSFESIGLPLRKSLVLKWNDLIKNVPPDLMSHFVRGLIDGDGSVFYNSIKGVMRFEVKFCSGSKEMAYPMLEWLKNNVVNTQSNVVCMKKRNFYNICFSYNKARTVAEWLYKDSFGIRLERKHSNYVKDLCSR